jgi:DNA polymerase I-like protein with 3'-5' exonuclease and polymerase domains
MRLAFDIEANGLSEVVINKKGCPIPEGDDIFCMCVEDVDTGETWEFLRGEMMEGVAFLKTADLLIGHNIIMYDIPMLERYYGRIDVKFFDTLIVSRLMYPDRQNHPMGSNSLKSWGEYFDFPKQEFHDFSQLTEEMVRYCKQDVAITAKIFHAEQAYVKQYSKSVKLEHKVARIVSDQIVNGFGFNLKAAESLEADLLMEKVGIEDDLGQIFLPITEERYSDKTGKRLKDKVTVFNPGSRKQIAERLATKYNWKPPKTEKGNPKVDEAVLKKLPYSEAKELVRYFAITKLLSQVEDWILRANVSRDGRIHGGVNTQGTVTGRMTASQPNLQQVSGDSRARSLFVPGKDWVQVGIDASGLEARLLASRMARWDKGAFAQQVLNDDIHTVNQKAAGLPDRESAKTFFYALIYGAGDLKIGQIVKKGPKVGKEIKKQYLDSMPALKQLLANVEWQVQKKGTITLLDHREVPCRAAHKSLNVQLQGDGAILMKVAQVLLSRSLKPFKGQVNFMATVHDEWQLECDPVISDIVGTLGCQAITQAGKILNCCIKMDGEFRVGKNWSECH